MALIEPSALLNYKKQKDLMLLEEDQVLTNYIDILDQIPPKDYFSFGVYYVPRNANLSEIKSLRDISVRNEKISKNHIHFMSMLG